MANNDWYKSDPVESKTDQSWYSKDPVISEVSPAESALRAFANAASFGTAPRISAAVNTGLGRIAPSVFGDESYSDRLKTYLDRDLSARQSNPKTAFVAGLAPNLLQAVATGGGSLARQVGTNAALGALNAAGNSRAESPTGMISDAAQGAAVAGAFAGAPALVGRGLDAAARKYTAVVVQEPIERLLRTQPPGWEKELARYMGETPASLKKQFGSVEQAGKDFLDVVRGTGAFNSATNVKLSDMPGVLRGILNANEPTIRDLGREAMRTATTSAVGAGVTAGANYAAGSPVDPLTAALAGGVLGVTQGATRLGTGAAGKVAQRIAASPVPENIIGAVSRMNRPVGAVNQMASQAVAAEAAPGGFRQISEYLANVDAEERRRVAMELQSSPEGRAMSNSEAGR